MTVTEAPCKQCGRVDNQTNPLGKAEIVLICAMATFLISAVVWSVGKSVSKPATAKKKVLAQTEIERLFAQAKNPPATAPIIPLTKPAVQVAATLPVQESLKPKPKSEPEKTFTMEMAKTESVSPKTETDKPKTDTDKPKTEAPKQTKQVKPAKDDVDANVAEYNKKLADFFSKRNADTVDGAETQSDVTPPAEPPSFDEWMKSGKPEF